MSRLDQHEAMVNYFNSLLTDPASPVLPQKQEKKAELSQKEVLEKSFSSENLSRMLESITAEQSSAPDTATLTETVAEDVTVPDVKPDSVQAETVVTAEEQDLQEFSLKTAPAAIAEEPQTAVAEKTETAVKTADRVLAEQSVRTESLRAELEVTEKAAEVHEEIRENTHEKTENAERWCNIETDSEFTALLFKVAGVVLAAPLFTLGGIFRPAVINKLFGKPDWYAGLTCIQKQKVSVVDTAKWMLPGKKIIDHEYKFVILCKDKKWCLQCDELLGTKTIKREDVKWRVFHGDRPWLAGILKKDMCALLHITELEKMLDSGLDIYLNQPPKTLSRR